MVFEKRDVEDGAGRLDLVDFLADGFRQGCGFGSRTHQVINKDPEVER
jgi:hypothetical protein